MSTQATGGLGTKLSVETQASPQVFTLIPEITSTIEGPKATRAEYDVTHFQSTGKEFLNSRLPDNGDMPLECNYIPSNTVHQLIIEDTDTKNFKIEYYDDDGVTLMDTVTFAGYFKDQAVSAPVDGVKKLKFSIRITGAATHDFVA